MFVGGVFPSRGKVCRRLVKGVAAAASVALSFVAAGCSSGSVVSQEVTDITLTTTATITTTVPADAASADPTAVSPQPDGTTDALSAEETTAAGTDESGTPSSDMGQIDPGTSPAAGSGEGDKEPVEGEGEPPADRDPGNTPAAYPPDIDPAAARELLAAIPVKGRAPKTGYDRAMFGQRWSDDVTVAGGHNGCDTRNDILRRDLVDISLKPGTRGCVVAEGLLHDPYTGDDIAFVRGRSTSSKVQIDHVVALSDAWQKGAQQLDADTRRNFANDPDNLLAVDGPSNMSKGAGDAATWLPPNKPYRCAYATKQIVVKARYNLWVTEAEKQALLRQLDTCR